MILLSDQPLELSVLVNAVAHPEHGGIATFLGTTRREAGEREVEALDYEAYEELALAEMTAVAAEAEARFGARVAVAHRVGRVEVGGRASRWPPRPATAPRPSRRAGTSSTS